MAGSLNKVIIIGRVGQDPKINYTQSGQAVANISVATDEGYKDKNTGQKIEKTEWHSVVAWRQSAEFIGKYIGKGRLVMIEGKLQTRKWQDQNGNDRYSTEIVADRVQALDRAPEQQQGQQQAQGGYGGQQPTYQQPQGQQPQQQPQREPFNGGGDGPGGTEDVPF